MDFNLWKEALQFNEPVASDSPATHCHSVEDILTREPCYYCIVDASWKSPHERAGIGWSLYSRQGTLISYYPWNLCNRSNKLIARS
ncbi:hypothetical protein DY000_02049359 [Brassica cretica]|uniref:Uncharacterized protein n=1 Tax=Brassica cretica TaxID=69181 RepID=A0ABQ7EQQ4_BRACR|nr:hypothetical protein DY000_02049359 [Brassica cretica]